MKIISGTVRKANEFLQAYQSLHGMPKPVKGNEQGAMALVPFALSGKARVALNENVAHLMLITKPHEEAVEVLRKQYRDRLDAAKAALADEVPDEDARKSAADAIEKRMDLELSREVEVMLERPKDLVLEPLQRGNLHETSNAFYPMAFALLLNAGLIEGAKDKPAKPDAAAPGED